MILAKNTAPDTVTAVNSWWSNPDTRAWIVEKPLKILLIILIALVLHWLSRRLIDKLARKAQSSNGSRPPLLRNVRKPKSEQQAQLRSLDATHEKRRISRIKTLAGVARSAVAIVIWVWAAMTILAEIGVNVAPLIASAGVVGVAIGFGAQSLIKDFLSGIFMLLEDQYGIGDTIDLGNGVFGDVEDITLRITTVRDMDGALWYVRNGEILQVANHSDGYAIARIEVPISLSNDIDDAQAVIAASAARAADNEAVSGLILEAPNMLGVSSVEPDYATVRIVTKTLPGAQWQVQRFIQGEIWEDMQKNDINTPYPHGKGIPNYDDAE